MRIVFRLAIALWMAAWPSWAPAQDRQDQFFDSGGVRIRYFEQGMGEPVVLVHGYTSSADMWTAPKVVEDLSKTFRVIALDCRGHGKSGKPNDPRQYGEQMAQDVVRLLDHLGIQKAHVVGYSMGALITAKLLALHRGRIRSAVLGGQGAILDPTDAEMLQFEQLATDIENGSLRTLVALITPRGQRLPGEEAMQKAEANLRARQDLAALAAVARSYRQLKITAADAAAIDVPALALMGSQDPLIDNVTRLKNALPTLKVVPIEGANHVNAFGRPEFILAVHGFLKANPIGK
ncbi:MAG: alpha/beta hydrolase [Betaproteobacteria bacterium]|nr:alpha/beta hydrolase [Betaproteobacteria bacterium]